MPPDQPPQTQDVDTLFPPEASKDVDSLFPPDVEEKRQRAALGASPVQDFIFGDASVSPLARVLDAFGQGAKDSWGAGHKVAKETDDFLVKAGIYNDYEKGQNSLIKAANQVLIRPLVHGIAAGFDVMNMAFGGGQAAVAQVGEELQTTLDESAPGLGQVLAPRKLFREIAAYPESRFGSPYGHGMPALPVEIARARDLNVIGPGGEAAWKGTVTVEPTAESARAEQLRGQIETLDADGHPTGRPQEPGEAPTAAPVPAQAPDIHAVARSIAPDLFVKYDELTGRRDMFRRWLDDLKDGSAATPDVVRVQARLQEAEKQIRELAPDVADAYQRAAGPASVVAARPAAPTAGPNTTHTEAAHTGIPAVDDVLARPDVKAAIDNEQITRDKDVPYGAGKIVGDGVAVDRHVPREAEINGIKFDPAVPVSIHENAEYSAMTVDKKAYQAAHTDIATPAEKAWVEAHLGKDAWPKYTEMWDGWLSHIEHENPKNPPEGLYTAVYPEKKAELLARNEAKEGGAAGGDDWAELEFQRERVNAIASEIERDRTSFSKAHLEGHELLARNILERIKFSEAKMAAANEKIAALTPKVGDVSRETSDQKLVVAREMSDRSVRYGKPGQVHADLLTTADRESPFPVPTDAMGFALPGGKFMSRAEALDFAKKNEPERTALAHEPTGLVAEQYNVKSPSAMVTNIAEDVTQRLVRAGRPPEEARAAAAIIAAHYDARAARFQGRKGTAQELYDRESPDILGPGQRAPRTAPSKRGGPAARDPKTWSMLEELASRGGLKPTPDLRAILGGNKFIPGFGPLLRENGMSLDDAIQALKESRHVMDPEEMAGREQTFTQSDLLEKIDEESRGRKQYRHDTLPEEAKIDRAEELHHIESLLDDELQKVDIDPKSIDKKMRARIIQIMDKENVRDPIEAFEQAWMEEVQHAADQGEIERTDHIPGWDEGLGASWERDFSPESRPGETAGAGAQGISESGDAGAGSDRGSVSAGDREAGGERVAGDRERELAQAPRSIETPEFKRWFGDSKVVDENGNPRVVYHGTARAGFDQFDTYASNYGLMGMGGYFTENPEVASSYTKKGSERIRRSGEEPAQAVYPAYLALKNPIDMDGAPNVKAWTKAFGDYIDEDSLKNAKTNEAALREVEEALTSEELPKYEGAEIVQNGLREMGFDGLTHVGGGRVNAEGPLHRVWVAFDPEQIKSTSNRGTYDPTDARILHQSGRSNLPGQTGLPGTEPISDAELAQRKSDEALKPKADQRPMDEGLFGSGKDQKELFQTRRGKIRLRDDGSATISLFKDADASTFLHETGHQWLEELLRDARDAEAPEDLKADAKTVMDWLGVDSPEKILTRQHEKFARGFETYLMEGRAPSKELATVFAKFKAWLTRIYQTVQSLRSPINDDIRSVFDRLIVQNPEPVIAPDLEPMRGFADIHEADATHTPPEKAHDTAETIQGERDKIAAIHAPEDNDARLEGTQDEARRREAGGSQPDRDGAAAGSASRENGTTSASGTVGARGGEASAQGAGARAGVEGDVPAGPNVKFTTPDSDLIDKAGNIRLDKLNGPEGFDAAIRQAAERNNSFLTERRGVISNGQALDLADALGRDPAFLDFKKIGAAYNTEEIIVAKRLLIQSATAVRDAMAKAADGGEAEVMALAEAIAKHEMIQGKVAGATAEWGRAGRALNIVIEGSKEAKDLNQFLKDNTGRDLNQLKEMAQYGQSLKTPSQVSRFVSDTANGKIKNAIIFYYVNALISGPITHFRYSVGNAINALWTPLVEIPTAAAMGAGREALGLETKGDRVYMGEAAAQLYGLLKGSREGISAAVEAWQSGQSPALPSEKIPSQFTEHQAAPIPGIAGRVLAIPGKSVAAIHSFFKSLRYEQNIQGLAYRTAVMEGLEGDALNARVSDLSMRPTETMMESATKDALKELFMAPTNYHGAMGALTRFTNKSLLAKIVVPFMKIGSQITRNAFIERTPIGLLDREVRENLLGRGGDEAGVGAGAARDIQAGKITAGMGLMGASVLMAAEGMMTGDGPEDPNQRAIWLLNHRPNSMTIGDITVPYQGLGHLGMLMRFSANMYETAHAWEGDDGAKLAVSFFQGLTKSVLDENFMRGAKDMLDAVYHPQEYGASYIRGFVTNWLPFSVGLSQVAREIDPYRREAKSIFDAAKAKIPWVSQSLIPQRDRFGEPIPNGAPMPQYQNDPVVQAMERLKIGVGKIERKIRGVELTDQQFDDYARIAGRSAKMRLNALVSNPGFAQMPPGIQIDLIHNIFSGARETARAQVIMSSVGGENDIMKLATQGKAAFREGSKPPPGVTVRH